MPEEPKDARVTQELHALEAEFGLSALEILDIINRRNRCKIAVRGAIAESHLLQLLKKLQQARAIDGFEDFDLDGHPDCRVDFGGRSFLVECKNVEKLKRVREADTAPITIDFQRTRAPIGKPHERYYHPSEFQIVAACLWNRTGRWDFRFAATEDLPRHATYSDRLSHRISVALEEVQTGAPGVWTASLPTLLRRLALRPPSPDATGAE